ncbi:hypothetical protein [Dyadobacter bucti]|jgi:hypothetical protein|uniref:hypothetical protein n=1 Tax=Dyadobacter bucti TaxID=2572203 RepID=UPI003F713300
MGKISKEMLTKIKGHFSAKYGIEMDDWSAMVMTEISQRFQFLTHSVDKSVTQIDEAAKNIKGEVTQITFKNKQEAFGLGLGFSAPIAGACSFIAALIFWYQTSTEEYRQLKRIAQAYGNVHSYKILMQEGEIVKREGQYCLTLTLADKGAGDILIGKEYVFDGRTKRILIPLGRN